MKAEIEMDENTSKGFTPFESMSFDELLTLRERLDGVIAERLSAEERELELRLARIKRLKQSPAVSPPQANGTMAERQARKLPVRYRNPEIPSQTWAGRGLQPRWLKQALKSGKKLSHFVVTDAE
jgi:DNA-binding protein H-NS